MRPGLFESSCPTDIPFLVESRRELYQNGHLLSALGSSDQGLENRGPGSAGAIERLLDGEHIGVAGSRLDKFDHRIERLIGVVKENVFFGDDLKDVSPLLEDEGQQRRLGRIAQVVKARQVHNAQQRTWIQRPPYWQ